MFQTLNDRACKAEHRSGSVRPASSGSPFLPSSVQLRWRSGGSTTPSSSPLDDWLQFDVAQRSGLSRELLLLNVSNHFGPIDRVGHFFMLKYARLDQTSAPPWEHCSSPATQRENLMEQPRIRIDALTGLRMFAAAAVFLSHINGSDLPPGAPDPMRSFLAAGYNGVTLFFILSGFVLAFNYGDRLGGQMTGPGIWSFVVARFARVYPLYLLVLLWVVAPSWLAGQPTPDLWQYILSVQTWSPDVLTAYQYNGPGWSIGVEMFLYACFPLLLLAIRPLRRSVPALLIVAALCIAISGALVAWFTVTGRGQLSWVDPTSAHRWLYRMPLTRLGDFVLGMTAAFLLALAPKNRPQWWGHAGQLVGGIALVTLMAWPQVLMTAQSWDMIYMAPGFLLILGLALSPMTWLARALSSRAMITLGEASFAFYLLHVPLGSRLSLGRSSTLGGWAFSTALVMGMITLAAVGLNVCVEKPARKLIRTVLDGRAPKGRGLPASAAREGADALAVSS